jgi:hypothetical protein
MVPLLEPVIPHGILVDEAYTLLLHRVSPKDGVQQLVAKGRPVSGLVLQHELRDDGRAELDQFFELVAFGTPFGIALEGNHVTVLIPIEKGIADNPVPLEVLFEDGGDMACRVGLVNEVFGIVL